MAKVKSSLLAVYLGVTAEATSYSRVGSNCESLSINLNPTETDYTDVTKDTTQTDLESYKVTIEGSGKFEQGDAVYDLFYKAYRGQLVLDAAKFPMCIVHIWDSNKADLYTGTTLVINSITLTGAGALEVDFKLSANNSPEDGTAVLAGSNNATCTFTATVTP